MPNMPESAKMAARFEHCDENISKLLGDKVSKNKNKASEGNQLIFKAYLQERNIQDPGKGEKLATVLRKFYVEVRTHSNTLCVFRAIFMILHIMLSLIQELLIIYIYTFTS